MSEIMKNQNPPDKEMEKDARVKITVHYSDWYQRPSICVYPHTGTADNAEDFAKLVCNDHVFFDFRDNRRSISNFLGTEVVAVDCDNDHSEKEADWMTLKRMTEIFAGVRFVAYTSRNHMKQKGKKAARPRFHMLFPVDRITSPEEYGALVASLQRYLPVFDENAMDAGRFYFGNKESKVYFHQGSLGITEFLEEASLWGDNRGLFESDGTDNKPTAKPRKSNRFQKKH